MEVWCAAASCDNQQTVIWDFLVHLSSLHKKGLLEKFSDKRRSLVPPFLLKCQFPRGWRSNLKEKCLQVAISILVNSKELENRALYQEQLFPFVRSLDKVHGTPLRYGTVLKGKAYISRWSSWPSSWGNELSEISTRLFVNWGLTCRYFGRGRSTCFL